MFSGSIVALVTPFTDSGGVDYMALGGLLEFHLEQGSDGLVIAGTTGESATLNQQEFRELLATVVREVDGAVPVLAGTGSPSTARAVEQTSLLQYFMLGSLRATCAPSPPRRVSS